MVKADKIKRLSGEEYVTGYLYASFSSQETVMFCNANTERKLNKALFQKKF